MYDRDLPRDWRMQDLIFKSDEDGRKEK